MAHRILNTIFDADHAIADPGPGGIIESLDDLQICELVTASAESRTLADPTKAGIRLTIRMKTDGGDCTVTAVNGFNVAGDTQAVFADVGDLLELISVSHTTGFRWEVIANIGSVSLSGDLSGIPVTLVALYGQSNALGFASAPSGADFASSGEGFQFAPNAILPLGQSWVGWIQGNMANAFAKTWVTAGGTPCVFVNCAVGGSSMIAGAPVEGSGGTWDLSSGTNHYDVTMKPRITAALAACVSAGLRVVDKIGILLQGEQEGHAGVSNAPTATYKANYAALIAQVNADFGMKTVVSELGTYVGTTEEADYIPIRTAQNEVCTENPSFALMGYTGAKDFDNTEMEAGGDEHYNQVGQNLVGAALATASYAAWGTAASSDNRTVLFDQFRNQQPDIVGFKKIVFTHTTSGAANPQFYASNSYPSAPTVFDCSGENRIECGQSVTISFANTNEKTCVVYIDATETDVNFVTDTFVMTTLDCDDGIGVGAFGTTTSPSLAVSTATFAKMTNLTSLNLSGSATDFSNATLAVLPGLTSLFATGTPSTATTIASCPSMLTLGFNQIPGMTSGRLDTILQSLAAGAVNGGTAYLGSIAGTTPPGAAGLAAKATLEARTPPWTVFTD
jgi:hypothetical protein